MKCTTLVGKLLVRNPEIRVDTPSAPHGASTCPHLHVGGSCVEYGTRWCCISLGKNEPSSELASSIPSSSTWARATNGQKRICYTDSGNYRL